VSEERLEEKGKSEKESFRDRFSGISTSWVELWKIACYRAHQLLLLAYVSTNFIVAAFVLPRFCDSDPFLPFLFFFTLTKGTCRLAVASFTNGGQDMRIAFTFSSLCTSLIFYIYVYLN